MKISKGLDTDFNKITFLKVLTPGSKEFDTGF